MKYLILLFIFIVGVKTTIISQQAEILVKNIFKHEIDDNGEISDSSRVVVKQKTYNKNNQLILERFYDKDVEGQTDFTLYTYDSLGRTKSIENYNIDKKPVLLKRIEYTEDNDTIKILEFAGINDTIDLVAERIYFYDETNTLKQKKVISSTGEIIEKTDYFYKKAINNKLVKMIIENYSTTQPFYQKVFLYYDHLTELPIKKKIITKRNGTKTLKTIYYSYNNKNKVVEKKVFFGKKLDKKTVYNYSGDIELDYLYEEDGNGNKISFFKQTYYWHKVSFLNIKSYFEN